MIESRYLGPMNYRSSDKGVNVAPLSVVMTATPMTGEQHAEVMRGRSLARRSIEDAREAREVHKERWYA